MTVPARTLERLLRRPRLMVAALVALVVFAGLAPLMQTTRAMLIAFDIGALLFLGMMALLIHRATPLTMRQRARLQDEDKWTVLLVSLCIVAVVLAALYNELHAAKTRSLLDIGLASTSLVLSWLFVAVMFSQQYAHSFYVVPDQLIFPGTEHPNYWDFLYFATVLSMCCQTSDVAVTSGPMRRMVMLHCLISFFFNVIIIAITVNVVAGVLL
jgi:uncharacterized membrane protein